MKRETKGKPIERREKKETKKVRQQREKMAKVQESGGSL